MASTLPPNPWSALPLQPPYILPQDRGHINWYNQRYGSGATGIIENSLPEPWVGDVLGAPVLILSSNPGHDDGPMGDEAFFRLGGVSQMIRQNLAHQVYDFYHLRTAYQGYAGYKFWHSALATLIATTSHDAVAACVAAVELHPYHSRAFRFVRSVSQSYTRQLVLQAIRRDSVIVVTRRWDWWGCCVPELYDHPHVVRLQLNGGVFITPTTCVRGLCPVLSSGPSQQAFNLVRDAVRKCAQTKGIPMGKQKAKKQAKQAARESR